MAWRSTGVRSRCLYYLCAPVSHFPPQDVVRAVMQEACLVAMNLGDVYDHSAQYADDHWLFGKCRHLRVHFETQSHAQPGDAVVIFITATLGSYFRMYNLAGWYGSLTGADQEKPYDELLKVFFLVLICIELTIFSICSGFCLDATKDKLKTKAMRAMWGRSKLRFCPPGCILERQYGD